MRAPGEFIRTLGASGIAISVLALASVGHSAGLDAAKLGEWQVLAPLPDPIGFGGMFAGVLNGRLVTGGGTQWDKPNWLHGKKIYSDRIFTLAGPAASWAEHPAKLSAGIGHFANATTPEAVYLVGGIDSTGCLRSVFKLRALGNDLVCDRLPDLPFAIGYGCAAVVSGRIYVAGGLKDSEAKSASGEVWSLDLKTPAEPPGWRREADLPGPGIFLGTASSDGTALYVFSGMEFDAAGNYVPSKRAARLDPVTGRWTRLADLPEARVAAASPCPVLDGNRIFVIGGYAEVFRGAPRDYPGFSAGTYYYHIAGDKWEKGPDIPVTPVVDRDSAGDPGPNPMTDSPAVVWQDRVIVISGEVRASVRSPQVLAWSLKNPASASETRR